MFYTIMFVAAVMIIPAGCTLLLYWPRLFKLMLSLVEMCGPHIPEPPPPKEELGEQLSKGGEFPDKPQDCRLRDAWRILKDQDFAKINARFLADLCFCVLPANNHSWLDDDLDGWDVALQHMKKCKVTDCIHLYHLFYENCGKVLADDRKTALEIHNVRRSYGASICKFSTHYERDVFHTHIGLFCSIIDCGL